MTVYSVISNYKILLRDLIISIVTPKHLLFYYSYLIEILLYEKFFTVIYRKHTYNTHINLFLIAFRKNERAGDDSTIILAAITTGTL